MLILLGLLRLALAAAAIAVAAAAIAAWFGFVVPAFDLLNHLQVLIITALLLALVTVPIVFIGSAAQWPLTGLVVLGLLASGLTVVPETLAAFAPRTAMPADGRPVIKLMTQNLFGLNYDMKRMAEAIAAENPDIVAVQEFFPEQRSALPQLLAKAYPYSIYCVGGKRANIGLFSRLPFVETQDGACTTDPAFKGRTAHIIANFTLANGQRFAVATTHFDWPYPIERQRAQRDAIVSALKDVDAPLLLVGDFNSTPWSYAQRDFATAAGLERQTHGVLTWPVRFWIKGWRDTVPILPLDQVMTRGPIVIHSLTADPATGSDHLPIVTTFSVGS